jgi:hypothetical protein
MAAMPPMTPFWVALVLTVALLVATLWTAWRGRRRLHLVLGPTTILALAVTIVLTEQLVAHYDFPAAAKAVHMPCAKAGGLLAVPVLVTGVWLWRSERARAWHRAAVWIWLVAVLAATATGVWMFAGGVVRAS